MTYRPLLTVLGLICVAGIAPRPASAQNSPTELIQKGPIVSGTGQRQAPKAPAPPGLPGANLNKDRVAPLDHIATDLAPTDALFDAINRGDINSARDALSRGADFNARNVLGLTPLDESIDLARNDITFLLLSLRGSQPVPASQPDLAGTNGKKSTQEAARKSAPAAPPRPAVAQAPAPKAPRPVAQAQSPRPSDGGAPNPQNGFLGFGG